MSERKRQVHYEAWRVAIVNRDDENDHFKLQIPLKGYNGCVWWVFVVVIFWGFCLLWGWGGVFGFFGFFCGPRQLVLNGELCFIDKANIMLEIVRHNYNTMDVQFRLLQFMYKPCFPSLQLSIYSFSAYADTPQHIPVLPNASVLQYSCPSHITDVKIWALPSMVCMQQVVLKTLPWWLWGRCQQ